MKLLKSFFINNKKISDNSPAYVIAEIGINHGGSRSKCIRLIKKACDSGADAVKLQIANPKESYSKKHPSYKEFSGKYLSDKSLRKLIDYAKSLGLALFATPGDFTSLKKIHKLKMPAIKISSGLLTNLPLIKEASKKKIPIIISTGMAYEKEIDDAINVCKKNQRKIALLKCTSIYPAPMNTLNLKAIEKLKQKYNLPVGYSDHSLGIDASVYAVALGASIIEKHFTLDKSEAGADHKISLEPKEFKLMVKKIRELEKIMGTSKLQPTEKEKKLRKLYYRKVVSLEKIKKGERFTLNNLSLKRTSSSLKGLKPKYFFKILGKIALKNVQIDKAISTSDFSKK